MRLAKIQSMLMGALLAAGLVSPAASQEIIGPDKAACAPGARGPAALVRVYGFKDRVGQLRVQLYGSNPDDWLAKGKRLRRIEIPMTASGDMNVCVVLPHRGEFALYAMHDRGQAGKRELSKDGFGFPQNPKLSGRQPHYDEANFVSRDGVTIVDVAMQYRSGLLSFKPLVAIRD